MLKDKIVEAIVVGVFVSLTAFMGSAIIRSIRNEDVAYANRDRIVRIEDKIDVIYQYIINKDGDEK